MKELVINKECIEQVGQIVSEIGILDSQKLCGKACCS